MAKVNIKITAQDEASKEIAKVKKSLSDLPQQGNLVSKTFSAVAQSLAKFGAGAVAVGAMVDKAFDFAERGAKVRQTADAFDRLTASLKAPPNLLQQLRAASAGTISDMQLMSATNTLLAGTTGELGSALAAATPKLMEIARAASRLNPALGDAEFMYQSLALGIKRNSPLILDNLGLIVKVGEANERYAAQIGKAVEQLTAEEQKQAMLNEVLRAGGVLIEQAGLDSASAVDGYARMHAAIENLTDAIATWFNPVMHRAAIAVEVFAKVIGGAFDDAADAHIALQTEIAKTAESYDEYLRAALEVARVERGLSSAGQELLYQYMMTGIAVGRTSEEYESWAQAMGLASEEQWKVNRAAAMMYALMQPIPASVESVTKTLGEMGEVDMGGVSKSVRELGRSIEDTANATRSAKQQTQDYFALLNRGVGDSIANLKKDIAFLQAGGGKIVEAFERVKAQVASGALTPEQGQQFLNELFIASQQLEKELGNISGWEAARNIRDTLGVTMSEAWELLHKFKSTLLSLDGAAINVTLNITGAGRQPGSPSLPSLAPPSTQNKPIPNATGGDWIVTRPTLFLAGEAGPERATFTPHGTQPPGETITVNIYAAVLDENAARRGATLGVRAALRARGAA